MAYDLFYRTQVPINCSRNPDAGPTLNKPTAALAAAGLVAMFRGVLTKVQREGEKQRYQKILRPGHHPTIEMPAMPMGEMMRYEDGDYQT